MEFECLEACRATSSFSSEKQRLKIAIFLCILFMAVEIVGGLLSKSLAILTDATHLLSVTTKDITGFGISLFSISLGERPPTADHSFGFQRAEILGSVASIFVVWTMNVWLIVEAFHRLANPQPIDGKLMLITSIIGIFVNVCLLFMLHHRHHHEEENSLEFMQNENSHKNITRIAVREPNSGSLNVKAAVIHAVGDLIQSIGVLLAAFIIWIWPNYVIMDPICTFVFCLLVFASTFYVLADAIHILMEGTPKAFDLAQIEQSLLSESHLIRAVHELHVWSLKPGIYALSVHVVVANSPDWEKALMRAQEIVCQKMGIHHSTIQVESHMTHSHCRPSFCAHKAQV